MLLLISSHQHLKIGIYWHTKYDNLVSFQITNACLVTFSVKGTSFITQLLQDVNLSYMYTDVPNTIGSSTHIWHNNMCTKICNFTSKEKKLMCYKGTNSCLFCQSIYTLACLETISFDYAMSGLHLRLLPGYNRLVISKIIDDKCDHGSISRQICIPITSFYLSFCNNRQNVYLIFITDIQY